MAGLKSIVEFGTSKIVCMISNTKPGGSDIPGFSCIRYDGIKEGRWLNYDAVKDCADEAIAAAETKMRTQIRSCHVAVPGCFTKTVVAQGSKVIHGERIAHEDIVGLVRSLSTRIDSAAWELIDIAPVYFLDENEDLYSNEPIGVRSRKVFGCFSFLYAHKRFISDIEKVFYHLHIAIDGFLCETLAQPLYFVPPEARDKSAVLVDVGYYNTDITVVFGDGVLAHSTIFAGGEMLVRDLRGALSIDATMAESLKRSHIFGIGADQGGKVYGKGADGKMLGFDAEVVRTVIEDSAGTICEEIYEKLRKYRKYVGATAPLYLIGGGMAMQGAETFLATRLKRKVMSAGNLHRTGLTPIYHSAISLLDNIDRSVYHLHDDISEKSFVDRIKNIFHT